MRQVYYYVQCATILTVSSSADMQMEMEILAQVVGGNHV